MKIEEQVCSLELAKKLKSLNVKQESLYYWWQHCNKVHQGYEKEKPEYKWVLQPYFKGLAIDNAYSAFTVAELGEMLPEKVTKDGWIYHLLAKKYGKQYQVSFVGFTCLGKIFQPKNEVIIILQAF